MIILKSKKINTFSKKISFNQEIEILIEEMEKNIKEYEETMNYEYMECSNCNSDELIYYGTYTRNVIISKECKEIRIKRVLCKNCGKTHAIIPTFIKAYFQYESSFIDFVVYLMKAKKMKSKQVEDKMNLSRQLIFKWRKRFEEHRTRLQTVYCNCSLEKIFDYIFEEGFVEKYYRENKKYYFEKIPT